MVLEGSTTSLNSKKDSLRMMLLKDMEDAYGTMVPSTKACGKQTTPTVLVNSYQMAKFKKVSSSTVFTNTHSSSMLSNRCSTHQFQEIFLADGRKLVHSIFTVCWIRRKSFLMKV